MMNFQTYSWSASTIGPYHITEGLPNQDACVIHPLPKYNCIVYVVGDGMGSCTNADIGSNTLCKAVIKTFECIERSAIELSEGSRIPLNPCGVCHFIYYFWRKFLGTVPPETARTTALIVIEYETELLFIQVGDGLILALDLEHQHPIFCTSNTFKPFSNTTVAVDEDFVPSNWVFQKTPKPERFILMMCTDGIADDLIEGEEHKFLENLFTVSQKTSPEECSQMMLTTLQNWTTPQHHDDKTIIFAGHWQ